MIYRVPNIIKKFYPSLVWQIPTKEKVLYLTFDDGPSPGITDWVLEELKKYDAKATFFCIGDKIEKYRTIFDNVISEGHLVANHTYNHLNGWKTDDDKYAENIRKCENLTSTKFFRPPYGRIKKSQIKELQSDYKIIMWTMLSWDFLKNLDQNFSMKNLTEKTKRGDIIVFHDSEKAEHNLKFLLPRVLEYFHSKDFKFEVLP